MAKNAIEKAMEKQQKEAKKIAEQEARRQRANAIVSGQPIVGGMRIMDNASEEMLKAILTKYDGNENRHVHCNDKDVPTPYLQSLHLELEKLNMYGFIASYTIWIPSVWEVTLTPQGTTYFEDKERAMEQEKSKKENMINIENIIANGSNLVLGNAINSTFSVENSTSKIEKEIEEKGGDDKEALTEILSEVKELIENMHESRYIPKNRTLARKLSDHLAKHGWFYAEVMSLLGAAAIEML